MAAAPGTDRIQRRFDLLRAQTEQQASAQKDQVNEDLNRQAAARGRLGSGSLQKVKMQAGQQQDLAKRQALEGVESQRDMALGAAEEAQINRDFARSEREASQAFASGEAAAQRGFMRGEREAGQEFSRGMSNKQMRFQKELTKLQDRQWSRQFKEDQRIADFNMIIARRMARQGGGGDGGTLGAMGRSIGSLGGLAGSSPKAAIFGEGDSSGGIFG